MKSKITQITESLNPEYPCLKINPSGVIILFAGPTGGTIIHAGQEDSTRLGEHGNDWVAALCEPYSGTVTLSN